MAVVEVDASDVGVEAVLSQRVAADQKLHPCAFFSKRLTPAERNYDIGNRELLGVKLALEEWQHWLKGTKLPFLVWSDHKNLEYIQSARRLNSRRSLFLTWFNFTLSYRPGSRNVKPDTLSLHFLERTLPALISSFHPPVWSPHSPGRWRPSSTSLPSCPSSCPPNRLFVPPDLRSEVLQWAHSSQLTCRPGIQRTKAVLCRLWWSSLGENTRGFVNTCPTVRMSLSTDPTADTTCENEPPDSVLLRDVAIRTH